jgi:nucleotide-binding universal stress UspA family protein
VRIQGPILAATALDPVSDEAVRQALELARDSGSPLVLCHVLPEIYGLRPLFPHLRELDREHAEKARRAVSAAVDQQLRRVMGGEDRRPELRLEAGSPHATVLEIAAELKAGLIVVGSGSHERGAALGGVAERIVRHAHCPVLVARPRRGGVVLAATDFSDPALPAIEAGHEEARRRRLKLVVFHSVEIRLLPMDSPEGVPSIMMADLIDTRSELATKQLKGIADRFGEGTEPIVARGPAATAILDAVERLPAVLVTVGTHGHTGLRRFTLGSVAEEVVRRAPCSVLVVRLEA